MLEGEALHKHNVERYLNGSPCDIVESGWPYECLAKDKHPDDLVFTCKAHGVWWHRPKQWRFDRDYSNHAQVEPFLPAFLVVHAEIVAAGEYPYDDSFKGRVPGIEGPDEVTAIYMLQTLKRLQAIETLVDEYLANGFTMIETLAETTRFATIVNYGFYVGGTGWKEWHEARLVPHEKTHRPFAVLPKGRRTRGPLISGGKVLAKATAKPSRPT